MNRIAPGLLVVLLALLLVACNSEPIKSVYTAPGDEKEPDALLPKTSTFAPDDDLNVVVKLNSHKRTLQVKAVFIPPGGGDPIETDEIEAGDTVKTVMLGLDWEARGAGELWPDGEWSVEVYVDGKKEKNHTFTVLPPGS
jgi:hypothetical protein